MMQKRTKRIVVYGLTAAVLVLGTFLGYRQICPPQAPRDFQENSALTLADVAGQTEPSMNMMLSHLKIMSRQMHVAGSDANRQVHDYLVQQLAAMGYMPQTEAYQLTPQQIFEIERTHRNHQDDVYDEQEIRDYAAMGDAPTLDIQNVLVHIPAPQAQGAVLVMAHYDSVKFGPGASDDLISVTALMETLRTLNTANMKNDLYVLFTDGEEQGLLGAACFVDSHPELKETLSLVVNVESRGQRGALLMFETTANNQAMIDLYRQGVPVPVSFSIATSVYQIMQNDTDLSEFMLDGYAGLNFACIEGAEVYHTENDTFEGIDRNTVYHYLQTTSGFVDYLCRADISAVAGSQQDAVFFPLLQGNLITMGDATAKGLAWGSAALACAWIAYLLIARKISGKALLKTMGIQLGMMAACGLVSFLIVKVASSVAHLSTTRDFLAWPFATPLFLILLAVSVIVGTWILLRHGRKQNEPLSMLAGMMPLLIVGAVGTALAFHAASYLFSLPLGLLLVVSVIALFAQGKGTYLRALGAASLVIGGLFTLLLFTPIVYLVYVALALPMAPAAIALAGIPLSICAAYACLFMAGGSPEPALA